MITIYYSYYEPVTRKETHSREHQLGRSLLSFGLLHRYGLSLSGTRLEDALSQNDYGKPYLKDYPRIHFSISHCDGLAACGFSDAPLGLDVEAAAPFRETIFRRVLTAKEQEFLLSYQSDPVLYQEYFSRFWTLKESRIKESGLGLSMPMTEFSFQIDASTDPAHITCSEPDLYFYQKKLDSRRVLSVCSKIPVADTILYPLKESIL